MSNNEPIKYYAEDMDLRDRLALQAFHEMSSYAVGVSREKLAEVAYEMTDDFLQSSE